jgi:hypothetical protein
MSKLTTLIMKLWYPHKMKMKINYKDQFSTNSISNDEIEKKNQLKKD